MSRRNELHKRLLKVAGTHTKWILKYEELFKALPIAATLAGTSLKQVTDILDSMADMHYKYQDAKDVHDYEIKIQADLLDIEATLLAYEGGASYNKVDLNRLDREFEDVASAIEICYLSIRDLTPFHQKIDNMRRRVLDMKMMYMPQFKKK